MAALPSELIEPLLADLFSWYLRDYAKSAQEDTDGARLRDAVTVINRITILNHSDGVNGVHASIASLNLQMMTDKLLRMDDSERHEFLRQLVDEADNT